MDPTLFALAQAGAAPPDGLYDIIVPEPERPLWPLLVYLAIALLLIGAIVWLVLYLARHRDRPPETTPAARTLRELDGIERRHDDLTPNRFALSVSDALKDYFAERFRDPVRYETAEEFLSRLSREGTRLPPAAQHELRDFLTASEEVKFGHRTDATTWTRPLLKRARQLVSLCESINAQTGGSAG